MWISPERTTANTRGLQAVWVAALELQSLTLFVDPGPRFVEDRASRWIKVDKDPSSHSKNQQRCCEQRHANQKQHECQLHHWGRIPCNLGPKISPVSEAQCRCLVSFGISAEWAPLQPDTALDQGITRQTGLKLLPSSFTIFIARQSKVSAFSRYASLTALYGKAS